MREKERGRVTDRQGETEREREKKKEREWVSQKIRDKCCKGEKRETVIQTIRG